MKRTFKIALLLCLISLVSALTLTACNDKDTPTDNTQETALDGTTPVETTPAPHAHTVVIDEAVAPTCTKAGITEGKHCSVCNEVFVAQTPIDALGHSSTSTSTVTPPTATEDGYTTYTCSTCGDTYTKAIIPTDFTVTKEHRAMIGFTGEADENLIIPAVFQHNGTWYRVTTISDAAFYGCTNLTSVTIPDSVTTIGEWAFYWCTNLTSVTIGASVTTIGERAFSSCPSLTSVTIPDSVTAIGGYAFYDCYHLTSVTIGDSVTTIGERAFSSCTNLTSITIPDSVTTIGDSAFYYCYNLTSVTIGDSVTTIGNRAFNDCFKLVEVINKSSLTITAGSEDNGYVAFYAKEVHNGRTKIVNQNDYLFYTYGGVNYLLGYVGTDTALTLPENYKGQNYKIYQYAFSSCTNLTSVTIGDSVTTIGEWAFSSCDNLTSVTIGDSVTTIGNRAFNDCFKLTSITFEGTAAQWNAISKGYYWKSYVPATEVVCSDGTVALN